jgi:hypothetical protein
MPLGNDMEVGRNIEQALQQQGPRLARELFQCQDTNVVIVYTQMAAMCLQLRTTHLSVKMAHTEQRRFFNLGGAEVYETAQYAKRLFRPWQLDLHEIV